MLFTLKKNITPPLLFFYQTQVNFVDHHKHLGINFSRDGKWHEYINTILSSASKSLGMMRKLKFTLHRKALNQIYVSFFKTLNGILIDCLGWLYSTAYEKDSLENIQNEAARIVTGLTRSASLENVYYEIAWLSLSERRRYQTLVIVYKSKNGLIPEFLVDLFPPNVASISQYDLRNNDDYIILNRRSQLFANSFVPSSTELWNQFPLQIRRETTLSRDQREYSEKSEINDVFRPIF